VTKVCLNRGFIGPFLKQTRGKLTLRGVSETQVHTAIIPDYCYGMEILLSSLAAHMVRVDVRTFNTFIRSKARRAASSM
jgi:hypothetical protein